MSKDSPVAPGPVLALISHPVKDFAAWRAVYDSAEPIRQKAGVTAAEVFRDPKDPNAVLIIHRFASVAAMQSFPLCASSRNTLKQCSCCSMSRKVDGSSRRSAEAF